MSVDGNYLILPQCKKLKIYDLLPNGEIVLTKKFLLLWNVFFPRLPQNPIHPKPLQNVLPEVNGVVLAGKPDLLSGFVNFKAVNFTPGNQTAVTTEGLALNFFVSGQAKLDFEVEWEGSKSIKYIEFYFWNPSRNYLRLNIDRENRTTQYFCRVGSAIFRSRSGYFFCRAVAVDNNYSVNLKVTALPHVSNALPSPNGCIRVCDQSIPLYTFKVVNELEYLIPLPQWQFIADQIRKTIDTIRSLPVPTAPILQSSPDHYFYMQTVNVEHMTKQDNKILTYWTSFTWDNICLSYFGCISSSLIVQDGGTAILPVDYDINQIKCELLYFNLGLTNPNPGLIGKKYIVTCYTRQDFNYEAYLIGTTTKIEDFREDKPIEGIIEDKPVNNIQGYIYVPQEVMIQISFPEVEIGQDSLEFRLGLKYPIVPT